MNEKVKYDVAIIGGGLAGLSLAILCAEKNMGVVLFEKEAYPYHKVCGEYISMESWNFLNHLGCNLENLHLPIFKNLLVSDTYGRQYSFSLPLGGFGISRYTLDHLLYTIAIQKGVHIYTKTKVTEVVKNDQEFIISTSDEAFAAAIVAGSFGKRSNLDIKWSRDFTLKKQGSLNNYIGVKYHIRLAHRPDEIALHNFQDGYCGMSKIENDNSCLCYLTTAKNLKDSGNSIEQMEKNILHKNPRLKEIFNNAQFIYNKPLTISQISFEKKRTVEKHILMLGDAAGMISPLCGNGMSMALHASKIAFGNIEKYLAKKTTFEQMESGYNAEWQSKFGHRVRTGRMIQSLFGGSFITSLFLKAMNNIPRLAYRVIGETHGKPF